MARWRLTAKHYLNVPGTRWEYKETDRVTGRPKNTIFPVPTFLDPEDPADWNYRNGQYEGEVIVATAPSDAHPHDIIFIGAPTPDMFPLDDEAKAISAKFSNSWSGQISDGVVHDAATGGHSKFLLDNLTAQVAELKAATHQTPAVEGMTELLSAMAGMMKQNQEMMAMLAKSAAQPVARRA